ncbi:hypothetical protein Mapa_008371 [Marchantia paleacea]|nr:hypothetical protein Mapa_008371 [Marchantia paleacea]
MFLMRSTVDSRMDLRFWGWAASSSSPRIGRSPSARNKDSETAVGEQVHSMAFLLVRCMRRGLNCTLAPRPHCTCLDGPCISICRRILRAGSRSCGKIALDSAIDFVPSLFDEVLKINARCIPTASS